MDCLTFHSYRGGVGKTLLSINTAVQLTLLGKKVCLLDFDLRAPSHKSVLYSSSLDIKPAEKSFTSFLVGKANTDEVLSSTNLTNFYCVFSDIEIFQKRESKTHAKLTQHGEGRILAKLFEFNRYCSSREFDYLIIDCMPGITYRSLDALVVSDKIFVVTRPVRSEIRGLSLVISECYSKLEGASIYAIMNQIEQEEDLVIQPNEKDINLANRNVTDIINKLKSEKLAISTIYEFARVPFVTERIYVLEEEQHRFSIDMKKFCEKLLEV